MMEFELAVLPENSHAFGDGQRKWLWEDMMFI